METVGYDIPVLSLDEILTVAQDGVLGDEAKKLNVDNFKSPTAAIVSQICFGILRKLEVNVENISQPHLQSSMGVKYPDSLNYMYKFVHIAGLMSQSLPKCKMTLSDIITPTWRRLRKIISAFVNYYRFIEENAAGFQAIVSKDQDQIQGKEELESLIEKKRNRIAELRSMRSENEDILNRKQTEIEDIEKYLENASNVRKKEASIKKEKMKATLEDRNNAVLKKDKEIDQLRATQEKYSSRIVGSPNRFRSEQEKLRNKLHLIKKDCNDMQDKRSTTARMSHQANTLYQLQNDILKMEKDAITRNKKAEVLEIEIQKLSNELKTSKLSHQSLIQDIDSIKQQNISAKERLSRCSLRWKSKAESLKLSLAQIKREKTIQESHSDKISKEVHMLEHEISKMKKEEKDLSAKQEELESFFKDKEKKLMTAIDGYHVKVKEHVEKWKQI